MSQITYPFVVVRVFAAVYQREPLHIVQGGKAVGVSRGDSFVRHPDPLLPDGSISPDCRELLIEGVQRAVREKGFRMCIVWGPKSCTFVEKESVNDSDEPPSGGLKLETEFPIDSPRVPRASVMDEPVDIATLKPIRH